MKRLLLSFMIALTALAPATLVAIPAYAATQDSKQQVCEGLGQLNPNACTNGSGDKGVASLAHAIVNILSIIVGIAAVIMIIIAGLKYVTSGGDSNAVGSAKNTLIYAIVGLIVVAIAQFIVHFVVKNVHS